MSSLGIDILESQRNIDTSIPEKKEKIFTYKIKEAEAKMKIKEEKYIVLKGSTAVVKERPSASESILEMRKNLKREEILVRDIEKELFVFQEDYIFNSPSYAASAIAGGNANGRRAWKYKGKSIRQLEAEEIESKEI